MLSVRHSSPAQAQIGGAPFHCSMLARQGETRGWVSRVAGQKMSERGGLVGQRWSGRGPVVGGVMVGEVKRR